MLLSLPNVLTPEQASQCRALLEQASWADGKKTAGPQAARAKNNLQLPPDSQASRDVGNAILDALSSNMRFVAAALPARVLPPTFNRYEGGGDYGNHIDNAIRSLPGTALKVRTDISATLFLTDPADYDGGELVIDDTFGTQRVKLPAGHMVLYPGTSLHRVTPVTRGARISAFFWIQSMVRDDAQRTLLWQLDTAIQQLHPRVPDDPALVQLTGVYHNLLRQWAET